MRKRVMGGAIGKPGLSSTSAPTKKAAVPIGDDLQDYLRTVRRWLDASEVAALLHYQVETVYRRIKCEGLPAHKDGKRWKFDPSEVGHWMKKRNDDSAIARPPMRSDRTTEVY